MISTKPTETRTKKRRVLSPDKRKKVSTACDSCKRRKYKCSGDKPCVLCTKKGIVCEFTILDKRSLKAERLSRLRKEHTRSEELTPPSDDDDDRFPLPHKVKSKRAKEEDNLYVPKSLELLLLFPIGKDNNEGEHNHSHSHSHTPGDIHLDLNGHGKAPIHTHSHGNNGSDESRSPKQSNGHRRTLSTEHTHHRQTLPRYCGTSGPAAQFAETKRWMTRNKVRIPDPPETESLDKSCDPKGENRMQMPDEDVVKQSALIFASHCSDMYISLREFQELVVPRALQDEPPIVFLILALGHLYKHPVPKLGDLRITQSDTQILLEVPEKYFETSLLLFREGGCELFGHWIVVFHYLCFHYYFATGRILTAWNSIGTAIKCAQTWGMHHSFNVCGFHSLQLFKSLYIADRTTSASLGRPFTINDYDWDDKSRLELVDYGVLLEPKELIHDYFVRLAYIIGKITVRMYRGGSVNTVQTFRIVNDLQIWAKELPAKHSVMNLCRHDRETQLHIILKVNLLHLHAVLLLCRPVYMSVTFNKSQVKDEQSADYFCRAALNAATLSIQLISFAFTSTRTRRCALDVIEPCFSACLVICTELLIRRLMHKEELMKYKRVLNVGIQILVYFSNTNRHAKAFAQVLRDLRTAITTYTGGNDELYSSEVLEKVVEFQKSFVPEEMLTDLGEEEFFFIPYGYET